MEVNGHRFAGALQSRQCSDVKGPDLQGLRRTGEAQPGAGEQSKLKATVHGISWIE
jgi:hypothetical protein